MIVKMSNIDWDTDGRKVKNLPKEVTVEVDDGCDVEYEGADILSDKFGFCVNGFSFEIVKE